MSLADLHPSLGAGPAPKSVCCGCAASGHKVVLVPVSTMSPAIFICAVCAAAAWAAAAGEHLRRVCEQLLTAARLVPTPAPYVSDRWLRRFVRAATGFSPTGGYPRNSARVANGP